VACSARGAARSLGMLDRLRRSLPAV